MKIAVLIEQDIYAGGGYQQALNMLLLLNKNISNKREFIFITTIKNNIDVLKKYNIKINLFKINIIGKLILRLRQNFFLNKVLNLFNIRNNFDKYLSKHKVDLIYFTSPSMYALLTEKYNYIFTVWDLCHRDFMEFPEVRENREFEIREDLYQHALTKALAIIVDSRLGKENIIKRYRVDSERINVISFSPASETKLDNNTYEKNFIDIKQKYHIDNDYVYYPAQFWAHKNHIYILKAIALLKKEHNIELYAIFSGSDKGNLNFILTMAESLGIKYLIKYIGFVPNKEIPYIYKQSLALVMPTYFGPTNLPPLEAFQLGVPVLYSNLAGLREQVGDAAMLVDLDNPNSLVQHLLRLLRDGKLSAKLTKKGFMKIEKDTDDKYWNILNKIFLDFEIKLSCWK
jgi:glycosyltransferase involved in cell wall biosynthesis